MASPQPNVPASPETATTESPVRDPALARAQMWASSGLAQRGSLPGSQSMVYGGTVNSLRSSSHALQLSTDAGTHRSACFAYSNVDVNLGFSHVPLWNPEAIPEDEYQSPFEEPLEFSVQAASDSSGPPPLVDSSSSPVPVPEPSLMRPENTLPSSSDSEPVPCTHTIQYVDNIVFTVIGRPEVLSKIKLSSFTLEKDVKQSIETTKGTIL